MFKLSAAGIFTALHSFTGLPSDGSHSQAGLVAARSGNLYGTTYDGGAPPSCGTFNGVPVGCGTVFKLAGTGFVVPVAFAGTPGKPNCHGHSVSALARQYGGLEAAAAALGFSNVRALQNDIPAKSGRPPREITARLMSGRSRQPSMRRRHHCWRRNMQGVAAQSVDCLPPNRSRNNAITQTIDLKAVLAREGDQSRVPHGLVDRAAAWIDSVC